MGKSIPYVSTQDKSLLQDHTTVIVAYAKSIGKNTADFTARDLRGYIAFLWKTAHLRTCKKRNVSVRASEHVHDHAHDRKRKVRRRK